MIFLFGDVNSSVLVMGDDTSDKTTLLGCSGLVKLDTSFGVLVGDATSNTGDDVMVVVPLGVIRDMTRGEMEEDGTGANSNKSANFLVDVVDEATVGD